MRTYQWTLHYCHLLSILSFSSTAAFQTAALRHQPLAGSPSNQIVILWEKKDTGEDLSSSVVDDDDDCVVVQNNNVYSPTVQGGCVSNVEAHIRLLDKSYVHQNKKLSAGLSSGEIATYIEHVVCMYNMDANEG